MVHELTHKRHWDSAKRFYKAYKKSYNTIEEAMFALNTSLYSYVKGQMNCDFNYLLKISPNAEDAFRMGNVNELVADVAVLGAKNVDPALFQKVEEVCSWK
ncbi:hypothetical protein JEQ21_00930 [Streptococcus sp. 121]|uniref:hypothetical protein n=1 Tax=Streptococcus sp. 121 TaxID=2797637 RepID=UPI0018F0EFB9|nr:hypothetical protein [Streptococcus sp. 121]MBJ6745033.1 hypothetical protein [Streptococcus sp. 121]